MNMPIFSGDAADIAPLQTICQLLLENGAWFHRELVIHAERGELSLRSANPYAERASYLRVPVDLMPALEDYTLHTDHSRQLRITPLREDIDPRQKQLMQAMVELYNLTGKLSHWESSYPGFAWQGLDSVVQHLASARPEHVCQIIHEACRSGQETTPALLKSFMDSRKFLLLNKHHARASAPSQNLQVLMPLIDCLNHSHSAEGYKIYETPSPTAMRIYAKPRGDTGELFVTYNRFDAVDTLLSYGFVDTETPFIYSAPCEIHIGKYTIDIHPCRHIENPYRSARLQSLRQNAPLVKPVEGNRIHVSRLAIPDVNNMDNLRLSAAAIGEASGVVKTKGDMEFFVRGFEEKLIEFNKNWWDKLHELTKALDLQHPASLLANQGCKHLDTYFKGLHQPH